MELEFGFENPGFGYRIWCFDFGVWGLGFRVWGSVKGLGFMVSSLDFLRLEFRVWGSGSSVWGRGFRVQGVARACESGNILLAATHLKQNLNGP